ISSSAFKPNGAIPARHTCDGEDVSPPLAWTGIPAGTRSLVLIVDDPDAPDPAAPKMTWVHWVLYDLPPAATGLAEHATTNTLPRSIATPRRDAFTEHDEVWPWPPRPFPPSRPRKRLKRSSATGSRTSTRATR